MCATGAAQPVNVGYACFEILPGETFLSARTSDPVFGAYGGFYQFTFSGAPATAFATYCAEGLDVPIPEGARMIRFGPGRSLQDPECPGSGSLSEITVAFT